MKLIPAHAGVILGASEKIFDTLAYPCTRRGDPDPKYAEFTNLHLSLHTQG